MARPNTKREKVERGITKITRTYVDEPERVTYQIRYGDGVGMKSKTFSTLPKARAALARARTQVMDGDHIDPTAGDATFKSVAAAWLAAHPEWKARTRESNTWDVEKKLMPLHGKRMKQMTVPTVARFREELASTPTSRGTLPAASSVKRVMTTLHAICEYARRHGNLSSNPCADLPHIRLREADDSHLPSQRQIESLIRRLASPTRSDRPSAHDQRWPLLVETAAYTGLRAGELAGLKKSDLNFNENTLTVRRTIADVKGGLAESTPKSKASRRSIPISKHLAAKLREFTTDLRADDYVFGGVGRDGQRCPLRHNQFQGRIFRPVVDELGLQITFHDLRHFHASLLIARRATALEVAQRLGHDKPSITLDRYAHLFQDVQHGPRDLIDNLHGPSAQPGPRQQRGPTSRKKKPF